MTDQTTETRVAEMPDRAKFEEWFGDRCDLAFDRAPSSGAYLNGALEIMWQAERDRYIAHLEAQLRAAWKREAALREALAEANKPRPSKQCPNCGKWVDPSDCSHHSNGGRIGTTEEERQLLVGALNSAEQLMLNGDEYSRGRARDLVIGVRRKLDRLVKEGE